MKAATTYLRHISLLAIPAALAACGGGGSNPENPNPPAATSLAIKGTAATGAAMANAAVKIACATGSTTATTDANGAYAVSITSGMLPCVLTATSSDGTTELHSVAAGTGSAGATSNITPLSELLIAKLSGTAPKTFVTNFGASTAISAADVTAAQSALLQTLTAAGVDTTGVSDIVGGTITPGSGTGTYDGVLEKLKATLAGAGVTLTDLTTAVSTTSSLGSTTSTSTVSTVLAPSATDCAGLKTGTLRVLDFSNGKNDLVQVDATALTAVIGGTKYTLTKNASCDYTANDAASTRVLVARSGIAVLLQGTGLNGVAGVAIPEQKLDVSALAGAYDRVQYGPTFDAFVGDFGNTNFAANGQNGLSLNCPLGYGNCVMDGTQKGALVANANGGFDYMEGSGSTTRAFAFRDATGRTLLLGQQPDGTVVALASQNKLTLPAVGKVASFWWFTVNAAGLGAVTADSNTVTAVDTTAGTASRQFALDGHFDTVSFNAPFDGTRYRAPNACTSSTGGAYSCSSIIQMPFGGLVLAVSAVPTRHFISVSIDKP